MSEFKVNKTHVFCVLKIFICSDSRTKVDDMVHNLYITHSFFHFQISFLPKFGYLNDGNMW